MTDADLERIIVSIERGNFFGLFLLGFVMGSILVFVVVGLLIIAVVLV